MFTAHDGHAGHAEGLPVGGTPSSCGEPGNLGFPSLGRQSAKVSVRSHAESIADVQYIIPERWRHAMKHSCVCKASAHQLQGELGLGVPYGRQAFAHCLY